MTRAVLSFALLLTGAGPALAAEGFVLAPGQWETRHVTVAGGKEDTAPASHCVLPDTPELNAASLAALVDPAGKCEILDASLEADIGLVEILCSGGNVGRGSLLFIPGTDEFAVYADVEFSGVRTGQGAVKVESRRTGTCPAP